MTEGGNVRLLADAPAIIPFIVDWYKNEWPVWFNETPLEKIEADFRNIAKLYSATHSAIGTFERAGWLGFDQVLHEGQTLTIFAKRIG